MTEIPEHLLKRSKERRNVLDESEVATTSDTSASATSQQAVAPSPTVTEPVAPSTSVNPLPPPDPAYVAAAKTRKKIPFWAMATLSLLPLWAFMYVLALRPQEKTVEGPLAVGAGVYGTCAGCHGADGQGGRALYQGEVMKTFPKIEDMLNFVYTGSQAFATQGLAIYGNPDRDGGAHAPLSFNGNPMPQQGEQAGGGLTETQILGVVCHERYVISGADPKSPDWSQEYDRWCSPSSEIFAALTAGTANFDNLAETFQGFADPPVAIGTTPRLSGK
ncbi:MAG: c-type cytochrome [Ilumatobacteraceae bacterium]